MVSNNGMRLCLADNSQNYYSEFERSKASLSAVIVVLLQLLISRTVTAATPEKGSFSNGVEMY